jgi:tRNA dimethylallyltransferase
VSSLPRLVIVVGPTGAGKTRLAIELAERAGGEIVSADSQQVYRGMDIGTGKATAEERARVPHHLLDMVEPDEKMTAARFVAAADAAIAALHAAGRPIVVAGGTGLYVRTLLLGLFEGPPADPALRAQLSAEADAAGGAPALWERLAAIDPAAAGRIERNDLIRITRALEVYMLTGVTMSEHQARHDHRTIPARYPARLVGLFPPTDQLYPRIDARVDAMLERGLLDEVRALRAAGYDRRHLSQQAIGYAELHDLLDGLVAGDAAAATGTAALDRAIELVKRNSRRYARRQASWYRSWDRSDQPVERYADASEVDLVDLERYLRG